jgi:hydrogenase maturation protein HypF
MAERGETAGSRIHITGVVQGVGFRPFVYALAQRYELRGWVRNTSAGVDVEVDGTPEALAAFALALQAEAPPLARIDEVVVRHGEPNGFTGFEILASQPVAGAFQPVSPDVSVCADCRRELFEPQDRRYRYPFINCTNCGPRFTIIQDIPYDRPQTTMAPFAMCEDCGREYHDPLDRRFHAQPVACPACGPHVWLEDGRSGEPVRREAAVQATRELLRQGRIVAIKGLGGFHLACDATNGAAVAELRRRKLRVEKPFALMMWDAAAVAQVCRLSDAERELLESPARPIVILGRKGETTTAVAELVAPQQQTLGVMLPYTPLHFLLLEPADGFPAALVMTSGNVSEEPIAYGNEEARERLAALADAFLLHDRDIHVRCDDSVVRVVDGSLQPLRRSRGYAPFPVKLPGRVPRILAVGGELKNTFCLARDDYAFLSHHIGDMENYETLRSFEEGVAHFERLFRSRPELLAYDLHPDYLASRYAQERAESEGLAAVAVQHHHAHIAACLAEHRHAGDRPVIGVAFDGTGYGDDGAIWGGEFLLANYAGYRRLAHLAYVPLPGGDRAVKEPWRVALAYLERAGVAWESDLPPMQAEAPAGAREVVRRQLQTGLNAPPTSSMGRLFDAVAALAGVRQHVGYEAQAAIELEALADATEEGAYPFAFEPEPHWGAAAPLGTPHPSAALGAAPIDATPLIHAVVADLRQAIPLPRIAARFHNGVAQMVCATCARIREQYQVNEVALSGGVWQNVTLLSRTRTLLAGQGFTVYVHNLVPANDGGLALGQAMVAARSVNREWEENTNDANGKRTRMTRMDE